MRQEILRLDNKRFPALGHIRQPNPSSATPRAGGLLARPMRIGKQAALPDLLRNVAGMAWSVAANVITGAIWFGLNFFIGWMLAGGGAQ